MITLLLFFIVIPLGVFILFWLFNVRKKKVLFGIPALIILTPIIFGLSLYIFRTPIQKGNFLSGFGPALSMFFPADDLYHPLSKVKLLPGKNTYKLNLSHKYVGRHAVFLEVPLSKHTKFEYENTLDMEIKIKKDHKILFFGSSDRGSPIRGKNRYGYYYVGYKVPKEVPVSTDLEIEINIKKDIPQFLKTHKEASIIVRKFSDQ